MSLLRPSDERARRLVDGLRDSALSYARAGVTRGAAPPGWRADETRVPVGSGDAAFAAASSAVRNWEMFDVGWAELATMRGPPRVGQVVALRARHFGFWSLNPCRVVGVIDEPRRYGFAYGTLPGHAMRGEERFLVELDVTDEVAFSILAVSRCGHPVTRLGYPLVRLLQARFRRDAARALLRGVTARDRTGRAQHVSSAAPR